MTTGRINQVAAFELTPTEPLKAIESLFRYVALRAKCHLKGLLPMLERPTHSKH